MYGFSIASCMSSALSEPDGAGLGTLGLHPELLAQLCAFPSCCQGGTGNHRSMSGALPTRRSQVRVLVPPTSECRLGLGNNLVVSGAARAP